MYYTREYLNRAHREIDTIFRVLFPEHGMAVREEQIMLCHKMLDGFPCFNPLRRELQDLIRQI